jgi:hypothetical protein
MSQKQGKPDREFLEKNSVINTLKDNGWTMEKIIEDTNVTVKLLTIVEQEQALTDAGFNDKQVREILTALAKWL